MRTASERRSVNNWLIIGINVLCAALLIGMFLFYNNTYQENLLGQNLVNIDNLTRSAGELSENFFENQQKSLRNMAQYAEKQHFSAAELLEFVYDTNADASSSYELLDTEGNGYFVQKDADGAFYPVAYPSHVYTALHSIFSSASADEVGSVHFAPEFTDDYTALKCFALYTVLPAYEADGSVQYYTLMLLSQSSAFIDMIQIGGSYTDMSSVLFDARGDYIMSNPDFKADNFFQYIYTANDLTLDEKNSLAAGLAETDSGSMIYKNSQGARCLYTYCKIDGHSWYIVSAVPLDSFYTTSTSFGFLLVAAAVMVLLFLVDIVWLLGLNRQLKRSMEQERRANSAKTDFLSRMSHDIRTPLNAVIGFSELAIEEPELPPTAADSLKKINSSGKYLLGLVNDILDMSKIESDKIELHETLVYGPDFLSDIAQGFSAQAEQKGIHLETNFSHAQTPWVYMDALRTRQIYSNLLNNAIKFSDSGTTVRWQITDTPISQDRIQMLCIISDEGCGMSEEFMKNLFQPFSQEHNRHSDKEGGTGLGLSIVKSLVDLMGGTIRVESAPNKGSTFKIYLERRIGTPAENAAAQHTEAKSLAGKRVLLCEDHPLNREIAVRLLTKQGILCETAENGQLGVAMFAKAPDGYYAAVLMDIRMPVMDGLEASRAIRASGLPHAKTVPIIAMTANAFADDIQNCMDAGMNDHIAKPVEPQKLYETLRHYL